MYKATSKFQFKEFPNGIDEDLASQLNLESITLGHSFDWSKKMLMILYKGSTTSVKTIGSDFRPTTTNGTYAIVLSQCMVYKTYFLTYYRVNDIETPFNDWDWEYNMKGFCDSFKYPPVISTITHPSGKGETFYLDTNKCTKVIDDDSKMNYNYFNETGKHQTLYNFLYEYQYIYTGINFDIDIESSKYFYAINSLKKVYANDTQNIDCTLNSVLCSLKYLALNEVENIMNGLTQICNSVMVINTSIDALLELFLNSKAYKEHYLEMFNFYNIQNFVYER